MNSKVYVCHIWDYRYEMDLDNIYLQQMGQTCEYELDDALVFFYFRSYTSIHPSGDQLMPIVLQ